MASEIDLGQSQQYENVNCRDDICIYTQYT